MTLCNLCGLYGHSFAYGHTDVFVAGEMWAWYYADPWGHAQAEIASAKTAEREAAARFASLEIVI